MSSFPFSFLVSQIMSSDSTGKINNKSDDANNKALLSLLDSLSNGDTILGKIVSSDSQNYVFKTPEGILVNARAEKGVSLDDESYVLFEVKKSYDSKVSLRPLNTNINSNQTAAMAIKAAGLPVNQKTMELTVRNMEYGNPIDKQSLINSYRDVVLNENVPIKYIVDLQKMDIPRTEANLSQYEAYLNTENSITESLSELTEGLADSIAQKTVSLLKESDTNVINSSLKNLSDVLETLGVEENDNLFSKLGNDNETVDGKGTENSLSSKLEKLIKDNNEEGFAFNQEKVKPKDILKPVLKEIFDKAVEKNFALNKENMGQKAAVKELFDNLFERTQRLAKTLENIIPKESASYSLVNNLSNNIDFMNNINNFIPYVQIPFKGENGMKSADLYVFRNKKSLTDKDLAVTAFIHLDTDNLGPADIYVSMKDLHITTNFCLSDESALSFIEKNISFLDKRLSEKGYSMEASFKKAENESAPIEKAIEEKTTKMYISRTSFDARA